MPKLLIGLLVAIVLISAPSGGHRANAYEAANMNIELPTSTVGISQTTINKIKSFFGISGKNLDETVGESKSWFSKNIWQNVAAVIRAIADILIWILEFTIKLIKIGVSYL